jgi:hypothetical protein
MSPSTTDPAGRLVEELVHTGLAVTDLLPSLLEGPHGIVAPEDGEAVIELLVSICRPALLAAPTDDCLAAAALIRAIRKQVLRNGDAPASGETTV